MRDPKDRLQLTGTATVVTFASDPLRASGAPSALAYVEELRPARLTAKLAPANSCERCLMSTEPTKGPASYFPSIEKKYGRPIGEWQQIVRDRLPAKHMDLVSMLKSEHGMGHGHANAVVAHVLSTGKG